MAFSNLYRRLIVNLFFVSAHVFIADLAYAEPAHVLLQDPDGLEVIQTIQDSDSSVPLIDGKTTIVRAYFTSSSYRLILKARLWTATALGPPVPHDPVAPVAVIANTDVEPSKDRINPRASLNFILKPDEISQGSMNMYLDTFSAPESPDGVVCDNCQPPRSFTFYPNIPLHVRLIGFQYTSPRTHRALAPSQEDFASVQSWLKRVYPTGNIIFSQNSPVQLDDGSEAIRNCIQSGWKNYYDELGEPRMCCQDVNERLLFIRNQEKVNQYPQTHYYALVPDEKDVNGRVYMQGCALSVPQHPDPEGTASGPSGPIKGSQEEGYCLSPDSYAGCQAVHELAHTFGREHPGSREIPTVCRPQDKDDGYFPYAEGQLSPPHDYIALDTHNSTNFSQMKLIKGVDAHDIMTYCSNIWPSAYTYRAIMMALSCEYLHFGSASISAYPDNCQYSSSFFRHFALANDSHAVTIGDNLARAFDSAPNDLLVGSLLSRREVPTAKLIYAPNAETNRLSAAPELYAPYPVQAVAPIDQVSPEQSEGGSLVIEHFDKAFAVSVDLKDRKSTFIEAGTLNRIGVVAEVNVKNGKGKITIISSVSGVGSLDSRPSQPAPVSFVAKDENGKVLFSQETPVRFSSNSSKDTGAGTVFADLPRIEGMREIELIIAGEAVDRRLFGKGPPSLTVHKTIIRTRPDLLLGSVDSAPSGVLSWEASAAPGVELTFTVQRRDYGSTNWETIALAMRAKELAIPIADSQLTANYRVIASDGFNVSTVDVSPAQIGSRPFN
jgi:hypothetical protein